jgi:hypothetical protein
VKGQRTPRPKRSGRKATVLRGGGETGLRRRAIPPGGTERIALWFTRDVATRLRMHAAKERTALSVVVERAVTRYLERAPGKGT